MDEENPYTSTPISQVQSAYICDFCGSIVAPFRWDDHVSWHETLSIQAGAVMAYSLQKIAHDIEEN